MAMTGLFVPMVASLLPAAPRTAAFAEPPQHITQQQAPLPGTPPTAQERRRAKQRARQSRTIFFVSQLYEIVLLGGFLLLGGTRWLVRLADGFSGRWLLAVLVIFLLFSLASALLTFPLTYYADYLFPHQWGLSNQTPLQWLRDYLVSQGIALLVGLPLVALGYVILRRAPHTWWLWLGALSVPVLVFAILIEPVFVAPLFNKFTPLRDVQLRQELLTLAHQQGIHAKNVFEVDASRQSNAVNAYVNGLGPTQRIVLYDTLLKYFTHDEIKFIMSHEMGHYVLGHIRRGLLLGILAAFAGALLLQWSAGYLLLRYGSTLGFHQIGHPASLPLLLALGMVLSILSTPITNAFSRQMEAQADAFAVHIDPHPEAGISAFHKLARLNIAEEDPPRWFEVLFYTHPSLAHRIAALQAIERETGER